MYADDFSRDWEHFELIDEALSLSKSLNKLPVVDLGAGPGTVTDYLKSKKLDGDIIAVDITPDFYQLLLRKYGNDSSVEIVNEDMVEFVHEQENDSFRAYLANFSIIHIPNEEIVTFFENVRRTLAQSGVFVASVHAGTFKGMEVDPYLTQKDPRLSTSEEIETYMNYFTKEELITLVENAGLTIQHLEIFEPSLIAGEIAVPKIWVVAQKES